MWRFCVCVVPCRVDARIEYLYSYSIADDKTVFMQRQMRITTLINRTTLFALRLFTAFHSTMNFPKNKITFARDPKILACICVRICHHIASDQWSVTVSVDVFNRRKNLSIGIDCRRSSASEMLFLFHFLTVIFFFLFLLLFYFYCMFSALPANDTLTTFIRTSYRIRTTDGRNEMKKQNRNGFARYRIGRAKYI